MRFVNITDKTTKKTIDQNTLSTKTQKVCDNLLLILRDNQPKEIRYIVLPELLSHCGLWNKPKLPENEKSEPATKRIKYA